MEYSRQRKQCRMLQKKQQNNEGIATMDPSENLRQQRVIINRISDGRSHPDDEDALADLVRELDRWLSAFHSKGQLCKSAG